MSLTEDFRDAVLALSAGTPYTVTPDLEGFDVQIDLADVRFHPLLARHHLSQVVIHRVRVDEAARTFTTLDIARSVEWSAGVSATDRVPRLSGSRELSRGRIISLSKQRVHAWDDDVQLRTVADYDFSSNEGHSLVRAGAARVGLTERWPWQARIAAVVAAGTGVLAVLSVIGLLIAWLAGAF